MSEERLYKALNVDGTSPYQNYEWSLPTRDGDRWKPGDWEDAGPGELVECDHGIHAATIRQLLRWLEARLYVLEPAEGTDRLEGDKKTVLRRARLVRPVETWTETTARLYAADCAEMVLPIYEDEHPDDDRPRRAIEMARAYVWEEATDEELDAAHAAVEDAAHAAVRYAVEDTSWAAAGAAAGATALDAWSAARAAAGVARDAVEDAAGDILSDRLALYLEHGEAAAEEPVPDIRELMEPTDE